MKKISLLKMLIAFNTYCNEEYISIIQSYFLPESFVLTRGTHVLTNRKDTNEYYLWCEIANYVNSTLTEPANNFSINNESIHNKLHLLLEKAPKNCDIHAEHTYFEGLTRGLGIYKFDNKKAQQFAWNFLREDKQNDQRLGSYLIEIATKK